MSSQMEIETNPEQSEQPEQLETAEQQEQIEEQPAKKQEFKDWSLSADVLIKELSEAEVTKLFPEPKKAAEKSDEDAVMIERFVDAAITASQRTRTENNAATFKTSGDPRIDFFFNVLEDTGDTATITLLKKSWNFNCLDTLRLIAYLRDIRSGKSIRYQYYVCLYWIYQHHPRTLLQNLPILIECGYWKDPLQLLMIILFNGKVAKYLFNEEHTSHSAKNVSIAEKRKIDTLMEDENVPKKKKPANKDIEKIKARFYQETVSEANDFIVDHYKDEVDKKYKPLIVEKHDHVYRGRRSKLKMTKEIVSRRANHVDKKFLKELVARYARERFNQDPKYRYFHLQVAEIMAKQLIDDLASLKSNDLKKISLAAKWAPSLQGHFDKYTLIGSSVALQIAKLTRGEDDSVEEIFTKSQQSIPIATMLARKNYQKGYIVKLREQLRIPERYMCTNQWDVLPYQMVASKCMQKNRKLFMKHDLERFEGFVKSKEKVSGATLKPPELVERAFKLARLDENHELEIELLEKQWNSMRDSIKVEDKDSCFKSALSVCDVSGSMKGTPMHAAIGLTIMTMSFTNEPWSNICLTFHQSPEFVHFERNQTLYQKVEHLREAPWGGNTNLTKSFKLILELATKHELKQSEMPKYLFIFSDMEFDQACRRKETNFEEATRLFAEKGYQLPTVVFWNLRGSSSSIPVQKNEQGTVLLSGYSAQQLSMLLKMNIDEITPDFFIDDILKMEKYENLVVVD